MEHSMWLHDILVFLAAAVLLLPIVHRLKSTSILGFLIVGVVVGPYGLGLIENAEGIQSLAELGVVFLLFTIGMELSLFRLRVMGRYVFFLGGLQVCATAFVIDAILLYLGVPVPMALIIGGALALSSTAFVTELLLERNELMSQHGHVAFAVLLLQDIAVIPMLVFLDFLTSSQEDMAKTFLTAAVSGVAVVLLIVIVGRVVIRPVFQIVARTNNPDLFVATTLLIVLGSGWAMQIGGLSMAMGAFLCGVLLAESEFRHQIEADVRPFKGLLLGLFFATVGMSLDLPTIFSRGFEVFLWVATLIAIKMSILAVLTRLFGVPWQESIRVGLLLAQGGEFAFVILGSAVTMGLLEPQPAQLVMAVVGISMVITPVLDWFGRRLPSKSMKAESTVPESLLDVSDLILIAGFGRVGQTVAKALSEVGVSFIAVDNNPAQVKACREMGIPLFFGDAARPEVLVRAGATRARAVVVALNNERNTNSAVRVLRNSGVDVPIIARSQDLKHSRKLEQHGANHVVPDTIEASLRLGEVVLETLSIPENEAREALDRLRDNEYALLEDLILADNHLTV